MRLPTARCVCLSVWFALSCLVHSAPACLAQRAETEGNGEFATGVRTFHRPHLTVVISIDQFRADYLRRLTDLFLPAKLPGGKVGGFRYLMTQGSYFVDARYGHFPLYTGPGHAVLGTGGYPYKTGIISNDWWDRATRSVVYCVDDPQQKVVGALPGSKAKPMGPKNLRSTTVGDELKLATGGAARVVTVALKDRASILLGGHMQDVALWYDDTGGHWISSTAYCKNGALPPWVDQLNAEAIPDKTLGTTWNPSVSSDSLTRAIVPDLPKSGEPYGIGLRFPHTIGAEKTNKNYRAFTYTPAANAFVFTTAERAIEAEKLGQRGDTPDYLALNLSTNDYVGHAFGPYSPESLDITVQCDRQISEFLNYLQSHIPGGLHEVVFAVSADHGVTPIPEELEALHIHAGRVLEANIVGSVQKALSDAFGKSDWIGADASGKAVGAYVEPYVYLNESAIQEAVASGKGITRAQIEEVAAHAIAALPGIYNCYTRSQILEGRLPATDITRHIVNGFHPKLSGDLVVLPDPNFLTDPGTPGPYATSHGLPYVYDTHVPVLISGYGIRPGVWPDTVSPADIVPTLCALLGVEFPSGCDGVPLKSALR